MDEKKAGEESSWVGPLLPWRAVLALVAIARGGAAGAAAAAMDASPAWVQAGCWVRITGLAKAPQHNGKVGKVSAKAAQDGRVGVELGKGQTLSVRLQNLEQAEEPSAVAPTPAAPEGVQRTLQRDNAVLQEFDGTGDPDTLVLYHHLRDRAFDAFNAAEYNEQMLRYYAGGITVTEVVPRKIGDRDYLLVCLRNKVRRSWRVWWVVVVVVVGG